MNEFIINQFIRNIEDLGLEKSWYWDIFLEEIETTHHSMQMGLYFWRPTLWWNAAAGMSPEEREWLEEKYPGWNDKWGQCWDQIIENMVDGKMEMTYPETLPYVCNMSQLPIVGVPGKGWNVKDFPLEYKGRLYHFGSEPDRWCFEQDPERYAGHQTLVDRFLDGKVQPPNLAGALAYMSLAPGEIGDDADNYSWVEGYKSAQFKKAV